MSMTCHERSTFRNSFGRWYEIFHQTIRIPKNAMSSFAAALVEELTKTSFSEEISRFVRTRAIRGDPIVRVTLASDID